MFTATAPIPDSGRPLRPAIGTTTVPPAPAAPFGPWLSTVDCPARVSANRAGEMGVYAAASVLAARICSLLLVAVAGVTTRRPANRDRTTAEATCQLRLRLPTCTTAPIPTPESSLPPAHGVSPFGRATGRKVGGAAPPTSHIFMVPRRSSRNHTYPRTVTLAVSSDSEDQPASVNDDLEL